jgi:hypothetical protein
MFKDENVISVKMERLICLAEVSSGVALVIVILEVQRIPFATKKTVNVNVIRE